MSKSNTFENEFLKLVFQNTAISSIGSGLPAAVTPGSLYIALHSADPGETGTQATSEISYTGYARVAVARSAGGWTVTDHLASNAATIAFPQSSGGSEPTVTHFSVGKASSGSAAILYKGALVEPKTITSGETPEFAAGTLVIAED